MSLGADRSYKMKLRDVENAFKYRRIPYPKRSVELIALLAISCTFFLFMHTNKLNSRLKEMEVKLQPSEFSALGLTGNHVSGHDAGKHDDINTLHGTYQYLKSTGQLASLSSKRLNNTRHAALEVIFFNRGAKVGSEALMQLTQTMAPLNNMTVVTKGPFNINSRTRAPRDRVIQAVWVADLEPGTIYIEHCNWLDFRRYELPKPIYINLVRDPVERMISWFYYVRSGYRNAIVHRRFPNTTMKSEKWFKKSYNECVRSGDPECQYVPGSLKDTDGNYKRQSLFYCGHNRECLPFDSPHAIQLAKRNVERDYAVVGSWEDTNITLAVLEAYIPRFFRGARHVFDCRFAFLLEYFLGWNLLGITLV
ncbi:heparan sulfate 2-O-sulfotransferase pipe-like isoform X7 [Drosophila subobscura]|uniref:heparan sulfate 2-O-sulfotransferase pipe-like isoform X7 n=1 Tax=Drosophila subobscura TaxID=7241 RepID=UPI00155B2E44|nr:heparan sulfate 2-O-sulfotransferase pipe-like isoform X7 [Drosophila subobscura]